MSRKIKASVWMSLLSLQRSIFYHSRNTVPEKCKFHKSSKSISLEVTFQLVMFLTMQDLWWQTEKQRLVVNVSYQQAAMSWVNYLVVTNFSIWKNLWRNRKTVGVFKVGMGCRPPPGQLQRKGKEAFREAGRRELGVATLSFSGQAMVVTEACT